MSGSGRLRSALAIAAAIGLSVGCAARSGGEPEAADESSHAAVAEAPQRFEGRSVRVSGRLENRGKNYFRDLQLVLTDDRGHALPVRPWLPASLPPPPPGGSKERPDTLSQWLGKRVELVGRIARDPSRGVPDAFLLEVESARKLDAGG